MSQQQRPEPSPAEIFEGYMVPAIFGPWSEALLDLADLRLGDRVLDVACGTGVVARTAAKRVGPSGQVVGLDLDPGMLQVAGTIEAAITWREGSATELPFADESFNALTCQQGLQFFPDRPKAVREMHRVLAPAGRLAVAIWCSMESSPGYMALAHALDRHMGDGSGEAMDAPFSFGDADQLRDLFQASPFSDFTIQRRTMTARFNSAEEFTRALAIGSVLRRTGVRIAEDALNAMTAEVTAELHQYIDDDVLEFPMDSHLVLARK